MSFVLSFRTVELTKKVRIKSVLKWLKYKENKDRFVFIITKSSGVDTAATEKMKKQLEEIFDLENLSNENCIFSEFPEKEESKFSPQDKKVIEESLKIKL